MIEQHDQIQWEECPVPEDQLHGRYRGFDLHRWEGFICIYPSEGDATAPEQIELSDRMKRAGFPNETGRIRSISGSGTPQAHSYQDISGGVCEFKERFDGASKNYCIEVHGDRLEDQLTLLDKIIDALWRQSGLTATPGVLPTGRWR